MLCADQEGQILLVCILKACFWLRRDELHVNCLESFRVSEPKYVFQWRYNKSNHPAQKGS